MRLSPSYIPYNCAIDLNFSFGTPGIGCHLSSLMDVSVRGSRALSLGEFRGLRESNLPEMVVQALVANCRASQYLLSGNQIHLHSYWGGYVGDNPRSAYVYYTCEIMELLAHFCAKDPKQYGAISLSPISGNNNHSDNRDLSRSAIWIPPGTKAPLHPTTEGTKYSAFWIPDVPIPAVGPPVTRWMTNSDKIRDKAVAGPQVAPSVVKPAAQVEVDHRNGFIGRYDPLQVN